MLYWLENFFSFIFVTSLLILVVIPANCRGSGLDGSCPIGPVLVAPAALSDLHNLRIRAILNGETVQDSNTK